jgi:hypothetical protein
LVDLGATSRFEVERVLMAAFRNREDLARLATEVI